MNFRDRIVINPRILAGKPIIKGTRIPVDLILRLLAQGMSFEEILKDYPHLTIDDIKAALEYASEVISAEEIIPLIESKT